MQGVRRFLAACLAAAALATVAGALFDVLYGGTTLTRSVAYALWFAGALCLAGAALAGNRRLGRRLDRPPPEGWVFVTASVLLTALGALIDAAG